jgi:hypothetical protein
MYTFLNVRIRIHNSVLGKCKEITVNVDLWWEGQVLTLSYEPLLTSPVLGTVHRALRGTE